jgi:hypothetical protein
VLDAGRNGTVPIETFICEKRVRDAELRAELPENDARLRQLYSLRNRIWNVKQTASAEGIDCSEFSEPLSMTAAPGVQLSRETTPAAKWHSIVNRGGESMWYPTRPQFEAKAETYAQAARERANKQQSNGLRRTDDLTSPARSQFHYKGCPNESHTVRFHPLPSVAVFADRCGNRGTARVFTSSYRGQFLDFAGVVARLFAGNGSHRPSTGHPRSVSPQVGAHSRIAAGQGGEVRPWCSSASRVHWRSYVLGDLKHTAWCKAIA